MTLFVGGLVIGFAIGWGLHWYLSQREAAPARSVRPAERSPVASRDVAPLVSVQRVGQSFRSSGPASEPAPVVQPPAVEGEEPLPPPEIVGYCVRCRQKRRMDELQPAESNGRPAYRGTCVVCGARMFALR